MLSSARPLAKFKSDRTHWDSVTISRLNYSSIQLNQGKLPSPYLIIGVVLKSSLGLVARTQNDIS